MNRKDSSLHVHLFRKLPQLIANVREQQGVGSLLCVGGMAATLCTRLRLQGIDARLLDEDEAAADECDYMDILRRLTASAASDEAFDHVVCMGFLEYFPPSLISEALGMLHQVARKSVFLLIDTIHRESDSYQTVEGRDWWEAACFEAGFRKHPAYYKLNPYAGLDSEDATLLIPLEIISAELFDRFPMSKLLADRDLHMDMMRESGRRSDGHVFRYHFAADYIPPNARVVDIACGMGYGSHLLGSVTFAKEILGLDVNEEGLEYAKQMYGTDSVRFALANAENIAGIASDSVDVICSFETLEHLPNPHLFLGEARRILKPGGRLILSVPNDWSDETGQDPNPYHFHVYTWTSLMDQLRANFIVDEAFDQTAGGGFKLYHEPRSFAVHDVSVLSPKDSEWAIVVAVKPLTGEALPPYEEPIYPYSAPPRNLLEFAKYYENAWLVHGIVESAYRLRSSEALLAACDEVLRSAPLHTADHGAALCVQGYRLLGREIGLIKEDDVRARVAAYIAQTSTNPHVIRWQVSLSFLLGELHIAAGRRAEAASVYLHCIDLGFEPFHPMLASKIIAAARRLAMMALDNGDVAEAKRYFGLAVVQLRNVLASPFEDLIGNVEQPLTCNYFDFVSIVDTAYHSAVALSWLDQGYAERGDFRTFLVDGGYRDALVREREELFETAEARLREIRRLAVERDQLFETAEDRLAEIHKLVTELDELKGVNAGNVARLAELSNEMTTLRISLNRPLLSRIFKRFRNGRPR